MLAWEIQKWHNLICAFWEQTLTRCSKNCTWILWNYVYIVWVVGCKNEVGAEAFPWGNIQEIVFRRVGLPSLKLFPFAALQLTEILNIHHIQDVSKMGSHIHFGFCKHQLTELLICLSLPPPLSFFHQLSYSCPKIFQILVVQFWILNIWLLVSHWIYSAIIARACNTGVNKWKHFKRNQKKITQILSLPRNLVLLMPLALWNNTRENYNVCQLHSFMELVTVANRDQSYFLKPMI